MRTALTAFGLGAAAFGAAALIAAIVAAALAQGSDRSTYDLTIAGVELVSFERTARGTSTTFGPGLTVIPLLGGAANAAAAVLIAVIRRRAA